MSNLGQGQPPAHAITDFAGHFLNVDDRFCSLVSRERSDIVGSTIIDLTAESDRPLNSVKLDLLRESGVAFSIRKKYLRGDGGTQLVENYVSLLTNGSGGAIVAATVQPVVDASGFQFAATIRAAQILLDEEKARLRLGPSFQGVDGRLMLSAYLLEARGAAVWAHELAEMAGGDPRENLLRIWELVRDGDLVVDGRAASLEAASVRVSTGNVQLLERHLEITLTG